MRKFTYIAVAGSGYCNVNIIIPIEAASSPNTLENDKHTKGNTQLAFRCKKKFFYHYYMFVFYLKNYTERLKKIPSFPPLTFKNMRSKKKFPNLVDRRCL